MRSRGCALALLAGMSAWMRSARASVGGVLIGAHYETWYTNLGRYNWIDGHGAGSSATFLSDVDGDGRSDAVAFFGSFATVALSTGDGFGVPSTWWTGDIEGLTSTMMADVNGDHLGDLVFFIGASGTWYVALSTGSGFQGGSQWVAGHGVGSSAQLLCNCDGSGRAAALAFFASTGSWYVALSTGSGFEDYSLWIAGHGVGSDRQLCADVTGDGLADAVVVFLAPGNWYVSASTGSAFNPYSQWSSGPVAGATEAMLADVNGDGLFDAVYYGQASWTAMLSSGSAFEGPFAWKLAHGLACVHGKCIGAYADRVLVGPVYGAFGNPPRAFGPNENGVPTVTPSTASSSRFPLWGSCAFWADTGRWACMPATPSVLFALQLNVWDTWDIRYVPLLSNYSASTSSSPSSSLISSPSSPPSSSLSSSSDVRSQLRGATVPALLFPEARRVDDGTYLQYDSADVGVIDSHAGDLSGAGVDFVLLDLTNGIDVDSGFISDRALAFCSRLASTNASVRYATSVGRIQYTHNPADLNAEAAEIWSKFLTNPMCGGASRYFVFDGKPLLIAYAEWSDRLAWETYTGDKSAASQFNLQWEQGTLPDGNNNPPSPLWGQYFGWGIPQGSLVRNNALNNVTVVMPGWNNSEGAIVRRDQGQFYQDQCWNVLFNLPTNFFPRLIMLNSWNEFAEETGIEPADTSNLLPGNEPWPSPQFYWNMALTNLAKIPGFLEAAAESRNASHHAPLPSH